MSWSDFLTLLFGSTGAPAPVPSATKHRRGVAVLTLIVILAFLVACQSPQRPMP